MATAVRTPAYLEGLDAETFDLAAYLAQFDARLLADPEGRRTLTRLDPLLYGLVYLRHHLRDSGGRITFGDAHLDWCRAAQTWVRPVSTPAEARDAYIAPRNMGKPVSVDAMVLMEDGSSKPLSEVQVGDRVITHKGRARTVTAVHEQGQQPSVLIKTKSGREVEAAIDHPFLTTQGWKNAGDLKEGDVLALVGQAQTQSSTKRIDEEFRLAGYIVGDGNVTLSRSNGKPNGMNAHISCVDPIEAADIKHCASALGFRAGDPPPSRPERYSLVDGAKQWIREAGLAGTGSHTKRVPEWVFTASAEQVAQFLGAYFACDGHVTAVGARQPAVEFYSVSEELMRGTQHLLLRLGVESRLRRKRGTYNRAEHLSWRLTILGEDNVARFAQRVPVHGVKADRLAPLQSLRSRFDSPLLPDPIVEIERGRTAECRCLTVEEDHTFTVEDIVVHNSTWWFLILPMWAAAHGHVRFAAAFASSATQAETHLSTFKRELDGNALLRQDFPDLCSAAKRPSGGNVADTQSMFIARNGFVFAARGIDSSNLGMKVEERRPDLILCDDIEPDESSYSLELARKRRTTLVDSILPLNVYARVVISGTVTMPGSVIHQLVKHARGVETAAWIGEEGFAAHYTPPIIKTAGGYERSVWPAKWPIDYLKSIEATRSFAKNYANDPMGADGALWVPDDFRYPGPDGPDPVTHMMLSIDPAVTAKKGSDYTGLAVVSWSAQTRRCTVHEALAVKIPPGAHMRDRVLALLDEWPQTGLILLEVNQGQDTWQSVFHHMPVKVKTVSQSEPKFARAEGVLNHYQRGRVLHARPLRELEEQMCAFPKAPHDDLVDAVGSAVKRFLPTKQREASKASSASYL